MNNITLLYAPAAEKTRTLNTDSHERSLNASIYAFACHVDPSFFKKMNNKRVYDIERDEMSEKKKIRSKA